MTREKQLRIFFITLAISIVPTLTLAQAPSVRIEATKGVGRYDDVKWSALSCYSPPCAANQSLDTAGNGKPYLLKIDQCDSKVEADVGTGELIAKGEKLLVLSDCALFYAYRSSSIGREILRTCPIGSRCHIETSIIGDSGIPFIVNIERIAESRLKPYPAACPKQFLAAWDRFLSGEMKPENMPTPKQPCTMRGRGTGTYICAQDGCAKHREGYEDD